MKVFERERVGSFIFFYDRLFYFFETICQFLRLDLFYNKKDVSMILTKILRPEKTLKVTFKYFVKLQKLVEFLKMLRYRIDQVKFSVYSKV